MNITHTEYKMYISYHSRFILEGVEETSQISLSISDITSYQNDLAIANTADVTGGKPITI
jgi:hypothetical protein